MTDDTEAQTPRRGLLDLPTEIVIQVVAHLAGDNRTLCPLARTCHLLQHECEKHIYKKIELLFTNDLRAILEAFSRRPERVDGVETLKILYRYHTGLGTTSEERAAFNQYVARMKALRDWHVESPYDNFKWEHGGNEWVEQDMEEFRKALEAASLYRQNGSLTHTELGLSKLEKLILHSHGANTDFWDLEGFHCLFRHPNLRYLHISCIIIPQDIPELEPYEKTTPLTTLIFDECELTPKGIGHILRTPKALKHLTLGENVYNIRRSQGIAPNLSTAPAASLEALKAVAHSLESLTHFDPYWRLFGDASKYRPVRGDGMRDFHQLRFVDIPLCSFLHQFILSPVQAPPNLKTLRLHHAREYGGNASAITSFFEQLPPLEPYTNQPSLRTIEFAQSADIFPDDNIVDIYEDDRICDRHAYAYKLHKRGIAMKVYLEASMRHGLIPPYLHGEATPELVCVYDSKKVGFRHMVDLPQDLRRSFEENDLPEDLRSFAAGMSHSELSVLRRGLDERPDEEFPETDQLGTSDILRLKNEVRRSLTQLLRKSLLLDDDSDIVQNLEVEVDDAELDPDFGVDFDAEDWFDAEDDDEEMEDLDANDDVELYFDLDIPEEDGSGDITEYEDDDGLD